MKIKATLLAKLFLTEVRKQVMSMAVSWIRYTYKTSNIPVYLSWPLLGCYDFRQCEHMSASHVILIQWGKNLVSKFDMKSTGHSKAKCLLFSLILLIFSTGQNMILQG